MPSNRVQSCLLDCFYRKIGVVTPEGLDKNGFTKTIKNMKENKQELYNKMNEIYDNCTTSCK